jgi:hypothetical protein
MRVIVTTLIFLFLVLKANIYGQINMQKLIGNSNENRAGKAILFANNYYLLGKNGTKATVTKLDINGNHIWTTETNDEAFWWDIIVNKDGNLMVVGGHGSNAGNTTDNQSLCGVINPANGNFNVLKSFDLGFKEFFFKIYANPSPANSSFPYYVTAVKTLSSGSNSDDLEIFTFDNNFSVDSRRSYSFGTVDEELFRDVMIGGPNGSFTAIGNKNDGSSFTGATVQFDKNLSVIGTRSFNQEIMFMSGFSKQASNNVFEQILAGNTTTSTLNAIILKVNGFNLAYSYKIPQMKRIFKIASGSNNTIYAVGSASIGGIDKTVIVNFQDNNTSLSVNWAKVLDQNETAFSNGFIEILGPNKYIFTDSRNGSPQGNGNFDMLVCVEDATFDNCMDMSYSISLQNNPMAINEFNIDAAVLPILNGTNKTADTIIYTIKNACAPPCALVNQIHSQGDQCGNYQFEIQSSGGTVPYTYKWDIDCDGSMEYITSSFLHQFTNAGTQQYCVTVTDAAGCTKVEQKTILVSGDFTPPTIVCPTDRTVECAVDVLGDFDILGLATATDNIDPNPVITYTDLIQGNSCNRNIVRTWKATDLCGLMKICVQKISILDRIGPVMICPPAITISCDQDINDLIITGTATVSDECSTINNIIFTTSAGGTNICNDITQRIFSVTDACGNSSTCNQTITSVDIDVPTIICPPNVTVQCGIDIFNLGNTGGNASATDNCSMVNAITYSDVGQGNACSFEWQRTFTVKDECENESSCTQIITVVDNKAPLAICPANLTINCMPANIPNANFGQATGTDDCGEVIITRFNQIVNGNSCNGTIVNW